MEVLASETIKLLLSSSSQSSSSKKSSALSTHYKYCQAQPQLQPQPNLAEFSSSLNFSTPPTQPPVKVVKMATSSSISSLIATITSI